MQDLEQIGLKSPIQNLVSGLIPGIQQGLSHNKCPTTFSVIAHEIEQCWQK